MNMLIYLMPIALLMGGMGLLAFLWSLTSRQYDDLEGAAWRILVEDETDCKDLEPLTAETKGRSMLSRHPILLRSDLFSPRASRRRSSIA